MAPGVVAKPLRQPQRWPQHLAQRLDFASHGAPRTPNLGQRNVCGRSAVVVLIAQMVHGACVAARALVSLFPTTNYSFEGDALCYAFFLIKELLTEGFARANTERRNS